MFREFYDLVVRENDFLGGLANLATVFALAFPLPVFVLSTLKTRRSEARERAFQLVSRVDSGDARSLRDKVLRIIASHDIPNTEIRKELSEEDTNNLRQFMNEQEIIAIHLNSSRVDETIFFRFWRGAYILDWDRLRPFVQDLRITFGADLYREWEKAVNRARRV